MGGKQRLRLAGTRAQGQARFPELPDAVLMGDPRGESQRADCCAEASEARDQGMVETVKNGKIVQDLNYAHPIMQDLQQRQPSPRHFRGD